MNTILNFIWCWLSESMSILNDYLVSAWDQMLFLIDGMLSAISVSSLTIQSIDSSYVWLLGACGLSQALAILGAALIVRFTLQSIPFLRWGS